MTQDGKSLTRVKTRQVPFQEIVTPVSARAVFWRPRYLRSSEFLQHLPFLFWLIDMQRPAVAVGLGIGDGVGYFGLCQAMDKLGEGARCHGLDDRSVEDGGPDDQVLAYNDAQYADCSRISDADPRDLVHRFEDGSVDLLLIDMALDQSLLQSLNHDWTRKLSDRAVILFHGTKGESVGGPEQGLLQSLVQAYPTVQFQSGRGLAAVLYGVDRLDKLERLSQLTIGAPGYAEVHHVFSRLGAANQHECAAQTEAARAEAAVAQAQTVEERLHELRLTLAERDTILDRQGRAEATQAEQLAALQTRLFEVQSAHDGRIEAMAEHAKAVAEVEANAIREAASRDAALIRERDRAEALAARLAQAEAAAATARTEAEAARAEAAQAAEAAANQLAVKDRALTLATERLEAARAAEAEARDRAKAALPTPVAGPGPSAGPVVEEGNHFEEIRALTLRLESAQQEVLILQKELRARADVADRLQEVEGELGAVRQHNADLMASTSWRITAPLRRFVMLFRR